MSGIVSGFRLLRHGWLILACCMTGPALAVDTGQFRGPGREGFVKIQEYDADGDQDGAKEIRVRRFRNLDGDRMFTMTPGEQLWA